jgi:hypothetical protein
MMHAYTLLISTHRMELTRPPSLCIQLPTYSSTDVPVTIFSGHDVSILGLLYLLGATSVEHDPSKNAPEEVLGRDYLWPDYGESVYLALMLVKVIRRV